MKFNTTMSVIVNMDLYYVIIICDTIIREEGNENLPSCLEFYKKGEYVARIPERNIDDLEWYESLFSSVKTIVLRQSFKNVF